MFVKYDRVHVVYFDSPDIVYIMVLHGHCISAHIVGESPKMIGPKYIGNGKRPMQQQHTDYIFAFDNSFR